MAVLDHYLHWLTDKEEWKDTKLVFELSAEKGAMKIHFTHIGLTAPVECYNDCVKGWDQYFKDSLYRLTTEGKGRPEKSVKVNAELAN